MRHHITREPEKDEAGYGDGLGDTFVCSCGKTFGEMQYDGFEDAFEHLESLIPNNEDTTDAR